MIKLNRTKHRHRGNFNMMCGLYQCQYPSCDTLLYSFVRCYHCIKGTGNLLFLITTGESKLSL